MTALTIKFRGIQAEILEEMIRSGIAETKSEAVRMALLNFALTSNLVSRERMLGEIRRRARKIKVGETELQKLIADAKETRVRG